MSPYPLRGTPTAVFSAEGIDGEEGHGALLVGFASGKGPEMLQSTSRGLLSLGRGLLDGFGTLNTPGGQTAIGLGSLGLAVVSSRNRQVRLFSRGREDRYGLLATLRTGLDPVALSSGGGEMAVVNRGSDDLWLFQEDDDLRTGLSSITPVGDEPSAVVSGECCLGPVFVTNAGSDTVTVLDQFPEDTRALEEITGEFVTQHTVPAGKEPSDAAVLDLIPGDLQEEEVVVANRGSGTVTVLDSPKRSLRYRPIGTYPVGREPTDIRAIDADEKKGTDLVVVNSGSDDVSILLNDGDGRLVPGGTFPVGDRPVALAAMRFNAAFGPDLAVINQGSRDLTILLRHQSGTCLGHDARPLPGSSGDDVLGGAEGRDQIRGLGGHDVIRGFDAADCLYGGPGGDRMIGGSHGDLVNGGAGDDRLFGGMFAAVPARGADTLIGGPGRDVILGGEGNDLIRAQDGEKDRIDCGGNHDEALVDREDIVKRCERIRVG